jgi:hypothetical protein
MQLNLILEAGSQPLCSGIILFFGGSGRLFRKLQRIPFFFFLFFFFFWLKIFNKNFYLETTDGCGSVADLSPRDQKVMGSCPVQTKAASDLRN